MPHHFGKAPVFLDNPATTGNAVDTQNIAAVAIASGRLQLGTGGILGTAGSEIPGCGPADIVQKTYHKARCPCNQEQLMNFFSSRTSGCGDSPTDGRLFRSNGKVLVKRQSRKVAQQS